MARDAKAMRGPRPFVFTNIKSGEGLQNVITWIRRECLYEEGMNHRDTVTQS
jgi:urease accessory protein